MTRHGTGSGGVDSERPGVFFPPATSGPPRLAQTRSGSRLRCGTGRAQPAPGPLGTNTRRALTPHADGAGCRVRWEGPDDGSEVGPRTGMRTGERLQNLRGTSGSAAREQRGAPLPLRPRSPCSACRAPPAAGRTLEQAEGTGTGKAFLSHGRLRPAGYVCHFRRTRQTLHGSCPPPPRPEVSSPTPEVRAASSKRGH